MLRMKCSLHENIAKNLVFVDGIARCGKTLFTGIVPSLENFEHMQFYYLMELIIPAIYLGTVSAEYAKAILRIRMNELAYNIRISRNVNFRYNDDSGISNYKEPELYYQRLLKKDGDAIVEELRKYKRFIPFQTHDLLVNLEHLNKLDIDYRMIALFRHPIDNSYSWWTKGFDERFGKDPRTFTLCIDYKGNPLPWYCAGYEEEWLNLNPIEKCIKNATDLIRRSVEQYKNTPNKDRIHLVRFEDFVQGPHKELEKICTFLGAKTTKHTARFIHNARCPRTLDLAGRERKLREFKSKVNKKILNNLLEMSESYETNFYGLK